MPISIPMQHRLFQLEGEKQFSYTSKKIDHEYLQGNHAFALAHHLL